MADPSIALQEIKQSYNGLSQRPKSNYDRIGKLSRFHESTVSLPTSYAPSQISEITRPGTEDGDSHLLPQLQDHESKPSNVFSILAWWIPELISSCLSVASLLCIVIVLRIYEGRTATSLHLPRFLTLNGLIAAIATLNRALLTAPVASATMQEMWLYFAAESKKGSAKCQSRLKDMDKFAAASAGAWGSLVFLFSARRAKLFTCVGCLITIVSLSYSTFTQQLLALDLSPSVSNATSPGNLPRSEVWAQWGGSEFDALSSFDPGLDMIGALYNGILAEGVRPLQGICPTGNCTWPVTPSMAACGGCTQSSFQKQNCTDRHCDYTFPSGSTTSLYDFANYGNDSSNRNQTVAGFQVVPGRGAAFNSSAEDRLYIMNVDLFGAPYWSFADPNPPLSSYECALWLCVKAYNSSMTSSLSSVDVVAQYDKLNTSYLNLNVSGLAFYGGTWYQFPKLPDEMNPGASVPFAVNLWAYLALQQYLYSAINGSVYWSQSQHFSNDLIRGIWNGTLNMDIWIDNVATSLSNVIRSTNTSSAPEYNGVALELTIQIRWKWLLIPIILVVSSMVFLLAVIIRTACSPVKSWKGSPLTLLLFDIDQDIKKAAHWRVDEHHGATRAIGETRVRLRREETGLRKFHAT